MMNDVSVRDRMLADEAFGTKVTGIFKMLASGDGVSDVAITKLNKALAEHGFDIHDLAEVMLNKDLFSIMSQYAKNPMMFRRPEPKVIERVIERTIERPAGAQVGPLFENDPDYFKNPDDVWPGYKVFAPPEEQKLNIDQKGIQFQLGKAILCNRHFYRTEAIRMGMDHRFEKSQFEANMLWELSFRADRVGVVPPRPVRPEADKGWGVNFRLTIRQIDSFTEIYNRYYER